MLVDGLYPNKHTGNTASFEDDIHYESAKEIYVRYFNSFVKDTSDEAFRTFFSKNKQFTKMTKYYDVETGAIISLPEKFLLSICASSGLASGNTKEEAFVQGLCEIFERYVNRMIYKGKNALFEFPTIDEKYFEDTNSYKLIQEIKRKGYTILVKDCTLNGLLPVLGIIVLNSSKTKYSFRIGSDINFDICLQRCVTELFQGLDFNTTFKMYMHSFREDYTDFWNLKNEEDEYLKCIKNGTGKMPRFFFVGEKKDYPDNEIKPFIKQKLTNQQVSKILVQTVKKMNKRIFIKDHSFLGFTTLRIYIPELSEVMYYGDEGVINTQNLLTQLKNNYAACYNGSRSNIEMLMDSLEAVLRLKVFSSDYRFATLLGINVQKPNHDYLLNVNVFHFAAQLCLYLRRYDEALVYLKKYHAICKVNPRQAELEEMIFDAMLNQIERDDLLSFAAVAATQEEQAAIEPLIEKYYNMKAGYLPLVICKDCESCHIKSLCNYPYWDEIYGRIYLQKTQFDDTYNYDEAFYKTLSLAEWTGGK